MRSKVLKRGFTLAEMAIVLVVMGAVMGGIYVGSMTIIETRRETKVKSDVITIVTNMRKVYNSGLPDPDETVNNYVLVSKLIANNILPPDMKATSLYAVQGGYGSWSVQVEPATNAFRIQFASVSKSGCVRILTSLYPTANAGYEQGVEKIDVYNNGVHTGTRNFAFSFQGFTVSDADTLCANLANLNKISVHYYLRPPQ